MTTKPRQIADAHALREAIRAMALGAADLVPDPERAALVGIRTLGVPLAEAIRDILAEEKGWQLPLGQLDITLYRDDLGGREGQPVVRPTRLDFDLTGRTLLLVDDVLYTGRTVRCALDQLMDYGRPRAIRLAVLVDRGLREMPIQAEVVGLTVATAPEEKVEVRLGVGPRKDGIWVCPRGASVP
jgi:pyrimidine operon attenuation protein/uracil phosphoribosyltransferase